MQKNDKGQQGETFYLNIKNGHKDLKGASSLGLFVIKANTPLKRP